MNYPPVEGSPLISPDILTLYFALFLLFLTISYIVLRFKGREIGIRQRLKKVLILGILIKLLVVGGGLLLAGYWFIPPPHIVATLPLQGSDLASPNQKIEIFFDRPVSRKFLEKAISPDTPGVWIFEEIVYKTHLSKKVTFYPTESLKPETDYKITLSNIKNAAGISRPYNRQISFKTQSVPKVIQVEPANESRDIAIDSKIKIALDHPNDSISQFDFQFEPNITFETSLDKSKKEYSLKFKENLKQGTKYTLSIKKTNLSINPQTREILQRGETKLEYSSTFTTTGPKSAEEKLLDVRVINVNPSDGWEGIGINSPIKITFDQEVDRPSVEQRFSLSPSVSGHFSWENNTLIFTPAQKLDFSTKYTVKLVSGIKSIHGLASKSDFSSIFTTQDNTVKLAVPAFLQQHALSCEVAALKMALAFRGVNVSEETLLSQVGVDPTPHNGNIWGNPYQGFVGNVDGRQMMDGFGVYWGPIAKAARNYRGAQEFEGWSVNQLTDALLAGNPVVIWVYAGSGAATSWNTPDGQKIFALRNEHAVTAVGFVGKADNPSHVIVNDPLVGQVYWSRADFDNKWGSYNRSGVVVF